MTRRPMLESRHASSHRSVLPWQDILTTGPCPANLGHDVGQGRNCALWTTDDEAGSGVGWPETPMAKRQNWTRTVKFRMLIDTGPRIDAVLQCASFSDCVFAGSPFNVPLYVFGPVNRMIAVLLGEVALTKVEQFGRRPLHGQCLKQWKDLVATP